MTARLCVGHHPAHARRVRRVNIYNTAQCAFVFSGFLGEDVALKRLAPLDCAACADH